MTLCESNKCNIMPCCNTSSVCWESGKQCVQCIGDTNCHSNQRCDTNSHTCHDCLMHEHCRSDSECDSFCAQNKTCLFKANPLDCTLNAFNTSDPKPPIYCSKENSQCVQCVDNLHCLGNNGNDVCNNTKTCVQCNTDKDCTYDEKLNYCSNHTCVECSQHKHCRSDAACDSTCNNNKCSYGELHCNKDNLVCSIDRGECTLSSNALRKFTSSFIL